MSEWLGEKDFYGSLIYRARKAQRYGTIKAVLWFQEEAEAFDKDTADAVQANTTELFRRFQRDLGVPIVFAQIGSRPLDRKRYSLPYWEVVKQKQTAIDMPGVKMILSDDLPNAGLLHFTMSGYRSIGKRFADALDP